MRTAENDALLLLTVPAILALNFAIIQSCDADSAVSKAVGVPEISIREPANGASVNAMWVDLRGTFAARNLKQITVVNPSANMTMPALTSGNTFEARNIFLGPGSNLITATAEDMAGNLGTNSIIIIGPSNANVAPTFPVQLRIAPSGGFAPLSVVFNVQAHVPGSIAKVFYDFDGDGVPDQINTDLQRVTHTYKTYGEYFPVVTIQTSVGRFSSLSGMLGMFVGSFVGDSGSLFVNVQMPPVLVSTLKIIDPVDVKWTASSNLYVLSGSTGTITEFDAKEKSIRSLTGMGSNPSGFDLDSDGNVYVAMTGDNKVWKFKPTANSFLADSNFGNSGYVGVFDGDAGSAPGQFKAPFDVAVSRDGQTITVSDSGNHRIQRFDKKGKFLDSAGGHDQFNHPKGLALDDIGFFMFIVDSGNNRIVLANDLASMGSSGTNGDALGQFNGAFHLSANKRALYVADTGNNRVQVFGPVESHEGHSPTPFSPRLALSGELGLNHPKSVAAVDDLLEEKLYIADTGNNRVLLVKLPSDNPEVVWKAMNARLKAGDVEGAASYFSFTAKDKYREAFLALSKDELRSAAKDTVSIKPVSIEGDQAQYYFDSVVDGQKITFPIEFDKEMGQWKILEY